MKIRRYEEVSRDKNKVRKKDLAQMLNMFNFDYEARQKQEIYDRSYKNKSGRVKMSFGRDSVRTDLASCAMFCQFFILFLILC